LGRSEWAKGYALLFQMDQHRHEPSPLSTWTVADEAEAPALPPRKVGNGSVMKEEEEKSAGVSSGVEKSTGVVSRGGIHSGDDSMLGSQVEESTDMADVFKAPAQHQASYQETIQSLTDQALKFLSTASNETIGACLVGLSATTYLVLGRVGLVLMGVVGGVVLHATWEGSVHTTISEARRDEERRRRELGLDVVKRAMIWRSKARDEQQAALKENEDQTIQFIGDTKLNFDNLPPETGAALTELVDAGIRDYVK
jgi:hypothetical protein